MLKIECPNKLIPGSKIAIVLEAPGECEVRQCSCPPEAHGVEPVVGRSGSLLNKMLDFADLDRSQISLLNVAQRRPKGNKFKEEFYAKVPITWTKAGKPKKMVTRPTAELDEWRALLATQLGTVRPNVVVACGAEALQALCGVDTITKYRGSVLQGEQGFKVIPALHPSYILHGNYSSYWITANDFKNKVSPQSEFPEIKERAYRSTVQPSIDQVTHFLKSIRSSEHYSLDIETRGGHLACLAIAVRSEVLCVPLQTTTGPYFSPATEAMFWRSLGTLFSRNPNLVGQNLTFDLEYLYDYGVEPSGIFMDTMVAHNLLYPELPKGLDFLCSTYLNVPYYKDEGKTWTSKIPDLQLWNYNNKDAIYTLWITTHIDEELCTRGLSLFYHDYLNGMLDIALEMQRVRLRKDSYEQETIATVLKTGIKEAHDKLVLHSGGTETNVMSPKQVSNLLYVSRGLPHPRHRQGKEDHTDENTLRDLYVKTRDEVCRDVILERHLRKRQSSYINIDFDDDGHLPFAVSVAGTESGRWSMKKSPRGRGCNAQTIPKIMRWPYVPPPGRIFLQPDLSQAEARVVAWLSRCNVLMEIFNDPTRNVHAEVARDVFGREVEKDSLEYTLAKSMVHASNYRMGPGRFAAETGLPLDKATKLLEKFHARFPEIRQWHDVVRQTILDKGTLETCMGRDRTFYEALGAVVVKGKLTDDLWREAISYIPQSTVADLTNRGMQRAWRQLGDDALWHNQSHDSFLLSVRPIQLRETVKVVQTALRQTVSINGMDLTIPSDVAVGYSWGMLKHYEGEETLSYGEWKSWGTSEWKRRAKQGTRNDYIRQQLSGLV